MTRRTIYRQLVRGSPEEARAVGDGILQAALEIARFQAALEAGRPAGLVVAVTLGVESGGRTRLAYERHLMMGDIRLNRRAGGQVVKLTGRRIKEIEQAKGGGA